MLEKHSINLDFGAYRHFFCMLYLTFLLNLLYSMAIVRLKKDCLDSTIFSSGVETVGDTKHYRIGCYFNISH